MSFARKKAYFPTNLTVIKQLFCFSRIRKSQNYYYYYYYYYYYHYYYCETILIFLPRSLFFLCLSSLLAVLLPTLSSFFCMELWLANFLGKGQIRSLDKRNFQRVICKQRNWQWVFPQNVIFL